LCAAESNLCGILVSGEETLMFIRTTPVADEMDAFVVPVHRNRRTSVGRFWFRLGDEGIGWPCVTSHAEENGSFSATIGQHFRTP
jgi:hypothetical protein